MNHVFFGARRILVGSSLALWMCLGSVVSAQTGPAPDVYLIHMGASEVLSDLKAVMDLTSPDEQKQYDKLLEHLELTLPGVDRNRPLRTDLLLNQSPYRMRTWIPVSNESVFWSENLNPNGIAQHSQIFANAYKLDGQVYPYFVWIQHGYAQFVEVHRKRRGNQRQVSDFVNIVRPGQEGYPANPITQFTDKGQEFGLEGTNRPGNIEERRELFFGPNGLKDALLDTHLKLKDEPQDLYDLNHLAFSVQLDELGRIFTEGKHFLVGGRLDESRNRGELDGKLVALPDTALQASMEKMGVKPSRFAAIPRSEQPVLSLRMNLFLDEMRRRGYLAILDQLRKTAINRINDQSTRTAPQKAAMVTATDQMYKLAEKTFSAGSAIGFVEMKADGQFHTTVAAMEVADGGDAVQILKTLQNAGPDLKVQFDIDKFGDVAVHSFDLDPAVRETYQALVGSNTIYVGTEGNAVWLAGGPNALDALKTAVSQAKPTTEGTEKFLTVAGRFGPWFAARQKAQGDKLVEPFRTQHRLAVEAAKPGDDRFDISLTRDGQDLQIDVALEAGVLRWLGKSLAHIAKEQIPDKNN